MVVIGRKYYSYCFRKTKTSVEDYPMGQSGEYECKDCGNQFGASEGRGMFFFEYRCIDCDTIKHVGFRRKSDEAIMRLRAKEIRWNCPECTARFGIFGLRWYKLRNKTLWDEPEDPEESIDYCKDCKKIMRLVSEKRKDPKQSIGACPVCGGGSFFSGIPCKCNHKEMRDLEPKTFEEEARDIIEDPAGDCPKCGGELRNDLKPMCPECKSRNTENISVDMLYD